MPSPKGRPSLTEEQAKELFPHYHLNSKVEIRLCGASKLRPERWVMGRIVRFSATGKLIVALDDQPDKSARWISSVNVRLPIID